MQDQTIEIFCCYAREDQIFLNEFKKHLALLQRQDHITIWADTDINAGAVWEEEIRKHLDASHIILLLISPDFLASDHCYSVEMQRALERHSKGDTHIIPIILRPVDWENAPFSKLQSLPKNAQAITLWQNRDEALYDAALGVRRTIESLASQKLTDTIVPFQDAQKRQMPLMAEAPDIIKPDVFLRRLQEHDNLSTVPINIYVIGRSGVGKSLLEQAFVDNNRYRSIDAIGNYVGLVKVRNNLQFFSPPPLGSWEGDENILRATLALPQIEEENIAVKAIELLDFTSAKHDSESISGVTLRKVSLSAWAKDFTADLIFYVVAPHMSYTRMERSFLADLLHVHKKKIVIVLSIRYRDGVQETTPASIEDTKERITLTYRKLFPRNSLTPQFVELNTLTNSWVNELAECIFRLIPEENFISNSEDFE